MSKKKKYKEMANEFDEIEIVEDNEENNKGEEENKIILKDIIINIGKIYHLKKGDILPTEINEKFFSSFKTEKII